MEVLFLKRIFGVFWCLIILFGAINVTAVEAKAKKGIDYNDPKFRETVDMLTMEGHNHDDLLSCAVKQNYYEDVAEMFDKGMTKKEILDYYENELGAQAILVPPAKGFNLALWITPFLLLVIVSILLYFLIKRWKKNNHVFVINEESSLIVQEDDIYIALIEDERKKKKYF
jgi:cytochrome c-type biogenesis protein CcmH